MKSDNGFPDNATVERLRAVYPAGCRVELVSMDDPFSTLPTCAQGAVDWVDDAGTVHVIWDSGSRLGAVYGVDSIRKV